MELTLQNFFQRSQKSSASGAIQRQRAALAQWVQEAPTAHVDSVLPHFLITFSSFQTQRAYFRDVDNFINFLAQHFAFQGRLDEVQDSHALAYKNEILHFAPATQRRILYALSSLFQFLIKRQLIIENPFAFVKKPRISKQIQSQILTADEMSAILKFCQNQIDVRSRDYVRQRLQFLLFLILFHTGFRLGEVVKLKFSHFILEPEHTKIMISHAKGAQQHTIFVSKKLGKCVWELQKEFSLPDDAYIFLSRNFLSHASPRKLYDMVKKVAADCGISKRMTPHSCRASVATLLHHRGVPLVQIQNFLNHKDIHTTALYLRKSEEMKEQAMLDIDISR